MFNNPHCASLPNVSGKSMTTAEKKGNISVDKYSCRHNISSKELTLLYNITVDFLNNKRTSSNVFYMLLPSSPLFSAKPIWLSHIATNLFATLATALPKPINPLQSPTHFFGFFKTISLTQKQSTLIFAKMQAKINKLCCLPSNILRPP